MLAAEELLPMPARESRDRYRWEGRKVSRDGLVNFDGGRYGVPWQYSGKEVQVRLNGGQVEIYEGERLLANRPAQYYSGKIV